MKSTQQLHNLGQRIWLDNITRELLTSGTLRRYIDEFSVTGLTSSKSWGLRENSPRGTRPRNRCTCI